MFKIALEDQLPGTLEPLAELVRTMRSPQFLASIGGMLEQYFSGIHYVLFFFERERRPVRLQDNLSDDLKLQVLKPYCDRMYLLDPFYRYWLANPLAGFTTLDSVAPQGFRHSEYFREYYAPLGLYDEAMCFFQLTDTQCLGLSFGFYSHRQRVDPEQLAQQVRLLFPVLQAMVEQFWLSSNLNLQSDANPAELYLLDNFAKDILSSREQEIARLIVLGYSSKGIAERLGIALGTVKNHRKHLYAKLQINSQAELFNLFLLYQNKAHWDSQGVNKTGGSF